MSKVIAVSMIFLLLATSGALADVTQDQYTGIGLANAIALLRGEQSASSMQNLVVDNAQFADGVGEYLFASVGQSGNADGCCGGLDVIEALSIDALQCQMVAAQMQTLGVLAVHSLEKNDEGLGVANALQTIVVNEGQNAGPDCGMDESATVMGMQTAETFGQPGAANIVDSSMLVSTGQSQAAL